MAGNMPNPNCPSCGSPTERLERTDRYGNQVHLHVHFECERCGRVVDRRETVERVAVDGDLEDELTVYLGPQGCHGCND